MMFASKNLFSLKILRSKVTKILRICLQKFSKSCLRSYETSSFILQTKFSLNSNASQIKITFVPFQNQTLTFTLDKNCLVLQLIVLKHVFTFHHRRWSNYRYFFAPFKEIHTIFQSKKHANVVFEICLFLSTEKLCLLLLMYNEKITRTTLGTFNLWLLLTGGRCSEVGLKTQIGTPKQQSLQAGSRYSEVVVSSGLTVSVFTIEFLFFSYRRYVGVST